MFYVCEGDLSYVNNCCAIAISNSFSNVLKLAMYNYFRAV